MKYLKTIAVAMMLVTAGIPASADNDTDGDEQEQYEEIDNFDFLYDNEAYGRRRRDNSPDWRHHAGHHLSEGRPARL